LAGKLLTLYAEREISAGTSFGPVDDEDSLFADAFPYEETPDQKAAIADVFSDMESEKPMDRLVCGDTGYGKTEVALRAAFKAVNNGKQVALLVPTTVLCDQHYETFKERFNDFPVRVGCVSRFFKTAENKRTLEEVERGAIDILIGTHRLLQKDVEFRDLGLLVIDEEHRFGVGHKEKLKKFRTHLDVLTLTATPIPRTLHMSLVSIRDLSVIETPPTDRHAIRTYLAPYSEEIIREALVREISRGGQVYFLHNRVQNIALVADRVSELVPQAKVEFAHGQMKERDLEAIMHRFTYGEIDVLVCTTIVESGLDIPNANTIVVSDADRFGLAQLYQLRGRVGRSSRRAYAYLLVGDLHRLSEDARKRLKVLQSLDDLGMGFRLAIQDMEIRGAGNLLGSDQSGQVNLVGFELYSRILKDAVTELRRKRAAGQDGTQVQRPVVDPELKIGFPAFFPAVYIPDVSERLILYQRAVGIDNRKEAGQLLEEIEDRFGRPPEVVYLLLERMVYRALLKRALILSAELKGGKLRLAFHPEAEVDPALAIQGVRKSGGLLKLTPAGVLECRLNAVQTESIEALESATIDALGQIGLSAED
jgi:transcription-repair coupling factor (superfamily II helicase)